MATEIKPDAAERFFDIYAPVHGPPQIVYVAYCHDRHIDPEIFVFLDQESAIDCVMDYMSSHVANPGWLAIEDLEDYVFYMSYGEEPDHGFVVKVEVGAW